MTRIGLWFAICVWSAFCAAPAWAQAASPESCAKDGCYAQHSGVLPAERIADRADEMIRLFDIQSFNVGINVYEMVRADTGAVTLDMRRTGLRRGEIVVPLAQADWDAALARWQQLQKDDAEFRAAAVQRTAAQKAHDDRAGVETLSVCMSEGADAAFDVVLKEKVTRLGTGVCDSEPLSRARYSWPRQWLGLAPFCAPVPEALREGCFLLDGDRFVAAQVLAPLDAMKTGLRCDGSGRAEDLAAATRFLDPRARVTLAGEAIAFPALMQKLCAKGQYGTFYGQLLSGRGDMVVVSGTREGAWTENRKTYATGQAWRQTWHVGPGGPRIVSWELDAPVSWNPN